MLSGLSWLTTRAGMSIDNAGSSSESPEAAQQDAPLLRLPPEVLHQILSHLRSPSLVALSSTCRQLHRQANVDILWAGLLRRHIPPNDFPSTAFPSPSYRDLYITHHPYWFVPRGKIWISNDPHIGRVMLCRFDPRRGCIEGYRLLADRGPSESLLWPYNENVVIHTFNPKVHLWLDDPLLTLAHDVGPFDARQGWREGEIKMSVGAPGHNTSASFFLSRNVPETALHRGMDVWPPTTIPRMPRARAASGDGFTGKGHKPQRYNEISETTFRMRHWSQFSAHHTPYGVRIGEEVNTWSTIDPSLYEPTPEKPYQGIYVGDYAGHGCEFLLVMQTEVAPPPPPRPQMGLFSRRRFALDEDDEASSSGDEQEAESIFEQSPRPSSPFPEDAAVRDDERVFTGALEAVKLTGDPNVPRGEHTFIADDIGPKGLIRIATEHPFCGARVVRSRGHVAARGFVHDEFIPSQLLMINHDCLAQYWVPFGHISFYKRVDIDRFLQSVFAGSDAPEGV